MIDAAIVAAVILAIFHIAYSIDNANTTDPDDERRRY